MISEKVWLVNDMAFARRFRLSQDLARRFCYWIIFSRKSPTKYATVAATAPRMRVSAMALVFPVCTTRARKYPMMAKARKVRIDAIKNRFLSATWNKKSQR